MNEHDATETAFNNGYKKGVEDTARKMADRLKQSVCDNTYPDFNKNGKPINVWKATTGYDLIDEIAKEILDGGETNDTV